MDDVQVSRVGDEQVAWLEAQFNSRWPWPRRHGFVADLLPTCPHFVARDADGRYLGHCHVRQPQRAPLAERGIPEIADLNVMPDSRRRGVATALLDAAEAHVAGTSREVAVGVGLYDAYGPAQRLYVRRGYVPDGSGVWREATPIQAGDLVTADDSLVLYLTKRLR